MKSFYQCSYHALLCSHGENPPEKIPCLICRQEAKRQAAPNEHADPSHTIYEVFEGIAFVPYVPPNPDNYPLLLKVPQRTSVIKFDAGHRFRQVEDWNQNTVNRKFEDMDGNILITDLSKFQLAGFEEDCYKIGNDKIVYPVRVVDTKTGEVLSESTNYEIETISGTTIRDEDDLPY